MTRIVLENHDAHESVAEILRLFDGVAGRDAQGRLVSPVAGPTYISRASNTAVPGQVRLEILADDAVILTETVMLSDLRRTLKLQLYQVLSELRRIKFPWGALTGVRPTQIAWEMWQQAGSESAARSQLIDTWFVSPEKAELALQTAKAEAELLAALDSRRALVYIGIPFCPTRCDYCSFICQDAVRQAAWLQPYISALAAEARAIFANWTQPVSAIYIGGGTPTSLPDDLFEQLVSEILPLIPRDETTEITLEAGRPDTISRTKLTLARAAGIRDICVNPQTMHDQTLQIIGRQHSVRQTHDAVLLARDAGFERLNMDLILGLPGEDEQDFLRSVEEVLALGPERVTLHALAIKKGAALERSTHLGTRDLRLPDASLTATLAKAHQLLAAANLFPYYLYRQKHVRGGLENTGFSKPGCACRYNVGMMSDQRTVIGFGSGATSKRIQGRRASRCINPKDLRLYIARSESLIQRKRQLFDLG